ncbi:MAG: SDR family oxidoreductase [Proteobacteria bacterium]|nr:SDR family oxidoreductase [Pseudomonadota bacterium]
MGNKWAIVTGSSSGIGLEMAKILASRGYNLVLVARSGDILSSLAKDLSTPALQVKTLSLDLTRRDSIDALVRQTDEWQITPDVLVNNAGVASYGPFLEQDESELLQMIELNMSALVLLSRLYAQRMSERKQGHILQLASIAAFQPLPQYAVYAASKSFVLSFSRALNFELRGSGVNCTALCPGPTESKFFERAKHSLNKSFEILLMKPEDVARQGLDAMFAGEDVYIAGRINHISAILSRFLPGNLGMRAASFLMK